MKLLKTILLILVTNLFACTEQEVKQVSIAPVLVVPCVFQNLQTAPRWVCDELVPGLDIQAVGMSEKSAAGQNYMKDLARIAALGALTEKLKIRADKSIKQYIVSSGVPRVVTGDVGTNKDIIKFISKALEGTNNHDSLIGPEGRIYVLVGLDKITTKKLVEEAVKSGINNEPAL